MEPDLEGDTGIELGFLQSRNSFGVEIANIAGAGDDRDATSELLQHSDSHDSVRLSKTATLLSKSLKKEKHKDFFKRHLPYSQKTKSFFARYLSGWRGGIAFNASIAGAVLILNVSFLIWGTTSFLVQDGLATVYNGECSTVSGISIAAHVLINVMSTLLLSASNYAMQVASSPSRADIDRAHGKQTSLDIGVLSIRNFGWVSKGRLLTYGLLLLSSIPLHFIYNSVLSRSSAFVTNPVVLFVQPGYFTGSPSAYLPPSLYNSSEWQDGYYYFGGDAHFDVTSTAIALAQKLSDQATLGQLEHIGLTKCTEYLNNAQQGKYESFVMVQAPDVATLAPNTTIVDIGFQNIGDWTYDVLNTTTDCFAGLAQGADCQIIFNSRLLIGVVMVNIVKCFVMILMVWRMTNPSLVTLGDGVASFLSSEDATTVGLRSIAKRFRKKNWEFAETVVLTRAPKRWHSAASKTTWVFSILICLSFVATAFGLLIFTIFNAKSNMSTTGAAPATPSVWSIGFGEPSGYTIISSNGKALGLAPGSNPFSIIILANTPQLLLSIGYLLINNLITRMLGAWEWSKIGRQQKTKLRTTIPRGQQQSTYKLQLPYRYSLSLMLIMVTLHYLVSTSFFIVDIIDYDWNDNGTLYNNSDDDYDPGNFGNGIGSDPTGWVVNYSPIAVLCTLLASLVLIAFPIALGFRRLYPGTPVVGSSSALISAACHPPAEEGDAGLLPVQWGLLDGSIDPATGSGRCTISSGEVTVPIEGQLYT